MEEVNNSDFEEFMSRMKGRLMKVSVYAKMRGVSTTWVYCLEREGKIRTVSISGVKFGVLDENEHV